MEGLDLVPASVKRSPTGRMAVYVAEMPLGEDSNLAAAVSRLCTYAVRADVTLIATVTSGAGKRFLMVGTDGVVHPVAAPAPVRTDYVPIAFDDAPARSLGESDTDEYTSQEWVDRYILDPAAAAEHAAPKVKKRRFLGRA